MYNPLYESLRKAKVDRRTATRVSVELNPQLFINREELLVYQKDTEVEMAALRNHSIEIVRQCEKTTVAWLSERDRQMREAFTRHHNETRDFLSGVDKRMAENEASLKQHRIESEARQDKRLHQMDLRARERDALGRAENRKFLAKMDKREARREAKLEKLLTDMDKREALKKEEQDKREALRQKEQEKCEARRDARFDKLMADMDKRDALRQKEQDKRDALNKAEQDKRHIELKLFVTQKTTSINRTLLFFLITTVLSILAPTVLKIVEITQHTIATPAAPATPTAPAAPTASMAPTTAPERAAPTGQQTVSPVVEATLPHWPIYPLAVMRSVLFPKG